MDGVPVHHVVAGDSLSPLVNHGDTCIWHPIIAGCNSVIAAGEVVFCRGQHDGEFCFQLVWRHETFNKLGMWKSCYILGNAKEEDTEQRMVGWCFREDIYGILSKKIPSGIDLANVSSGCNSRQMNRDFPP